MDKQNSSTTYRRLLLFVLGGLLALSGGIAYWFFHTSPTSDIRPITWGVSKTEIKNQEWAALESEGPDKLIYRTTLLNSVPAALGYDFKDDALNSLKYVSLLKYKEFRYCVSVFQQLQNVVYEQYGKPEITTADDFREAVWQTATTTVHLKILEISGEQFIWMLTFQPS